MITDQELDVVVQEISHSNFRLGSGSVHAILRQRGHIVQRDRVRASLQRVDPEGVALRWGQTVQRRNYCVHGPNSLWHIDGNHKLIRYAGLFYILYIDSCTINLSLLTTFSINFMFILYSGTGLSSMGE